MIQYEPTPTRKANTQNINISMITAPVSLPNMPIIGPRYLSSIRFVRIVGGDFTTTKYNKNYILKNVKLRNLSIKYRGGVPYHLHNVLYARKKFKTSNQNI